MSKKPTVTTVASGYYGRVALNDNFEALRDAFDNTLSRDGSTPNAMGADLDMNSNDILNVNDISTSSLRLNGVLVSPADLSTAGSVMYSNKYTGDGSTVAYTLSYDPFIKDNTLVYIDGVYQNKDGYAVSGTTLTFTEAPPLNSLVEVVVARTLQDVGTADASAVTYSQGGTGAQTRTVENKLQEFVSVKDFGAVGDGVTDDTAAINNALASGSAQIFFPKGNYLTTGLHAIPTQTRVFGEEGTVIVPSGNPANVFNVIDTDSDQRDNITIENFELNGNCTYFVRFEGGYSYFHTIKNIKLSGGSGTALFYWYVTSTTRQPARVDIVDIDARRSGWESVVRMQRSAAAVSAGIYADNFFIRRVNSWADVAVIDLQFSVSSFVLRDIYGGLFSGTSNAGVIKISSDDATYSRHCEIRTIHLEGWDTGCRAVDIDRIFNSEICNIKAIRINTTKAGMRAVKLQNSYGNFISTAGIKDTGNVEISGFYAALEFDANTHDNFIFMQSSDYALRVTDNGYKNVFPGIRNLKYLYADTSRVTKTGVISVQETIKSYTIPANTLNTADGLRVFAAGSTTGTGTKRFQLILDDGTTSDVIAQFWDTPAAAWRLDVDIWNVGSANQRTSILSHWNGAIVAQTASSETQDFTADVQVRLDVISIGDAGATIDVDAFYIEPVYKVT